MHCGNSSLHVKLSDAGKKYFNIKRAIKRDTNRQIGNINIEQGYAFVSFY